MNRNCQPQQIELPLKPIPQSNQQAPPGVTKLTLRELFDAEESSLLRYAYSIVGRRAVAEEIVQEVFLKLHTQWHEVDSPKAWLFRSVRNRAFNHQRDRKKELLNCDSTTIQLPATTSQTAEAELQCQEARGRLHLMLEELNETDRELVKLKYFENLKYRDISKRTGLSVSNVGYRLHHILKGLANKLRQSGIDEMP